MESHLADMEDSQQDDSFQASQEGVLLLYLSWHSYYKSYDRDHSYYLVSLSQQEIYEVIQQEERARQPALAPLLLPGKKSSCADEKTRSISEKNTNTYNNSNNSRGESLGDLRELEISFVEGPAR